MDKKVSLNCISQRNPLSLAQDKIAQVKIMLRPSSFDKDERAAKRRIKLTSSSLFLSVLISFLSIGHRTIKRNVTWWSWQNQGAQNPKRFQEWAKKTKFQECVKICPTGQTGYPCPRASPVHRTCPVPLPDSKDIYWTCPVLDHTSPVNNMTIRIWAPPN
jgi:hypothetical protein